MDGIVIFKTDLKKNKFLKLLVNQKLEMSSHQILKRVKQNLFILAHLSQGLNKIVIPKENYVFYEKKNS